MPRRDLCVVHIGLDDFDLDIYGCTTHAATFLIHKLSKYLPLQLLDYPNLVRLNPSIPWKTRGNGAVAIRIQVPCNYTDRLIDLVHRILMEYLEKLAIYTNTNHIIYGREPGVVIVFGPPPQILYNVYISALTDIVLPSIVLEKLRHGRESIYVSDVFNGRGVVGATAAIGWIIDTSDYTYELIAYRSKYRYLEDRCVDVESVKLFESLTYRSTFNNIDPETNRILVTPRGHDPILYGVRGDDDECVRKALNVIKTCEPIVAWTIFRTNQGTDAHAIDRYVSDLRVYRTAKLKLRIVDDPVVIPGGHVIVKGGDATGSVNMVFFKPSGLAGVAQKLCIGDEVIVQGHVKPWRDAAYLHVEKLYIISLATQYSCKAPRCPICGKRMTKKGFGKGYRCRFCNYESLVIELDCRAVERDLALGIYIPPPSEQKHLIKPIKRYGKEKNSHPPLQPIPLDKVSCVIEPLWFL